MPSELFFFALSALVNNTYPVSRAILMKPFQSFNVIVHDPGQASSDSAAPPTIMIAMLLPPSLVQM